MARLSMLIDLTRCIGCDACTVACKQENGTPMDVFFARVLNVEAGTYPNVKRLYIPVLCNHCEYPPCLKACPNKAIVQRHDGIVLIDQDRCRGTGACVSACPYGNIILRPEDKWYLNDDEPYESKFVRPRLNANVARKCTYCAHRVDDGLKPACVVACPTTARIFGDLEDAESDISKYIVEQEAATGRTPFKLIPEAGTKPAGMYLGTMAAQDSSTLGNRAGVERPEPLPKVAARGKSGVLATILIFLLGFALLAVAAKAGAQEPAKSDVFSTASCQGCHGMSAMGGLGPPIAQPGAHNIDQVKFVDTVRKGKGMMPGTAAKDLSDADVQALYNELQAKPWDETQIPIAFKVGQLLTTKNVAMIFTFVGLFAFFFGTKVWIHWIKLAAPKKLWPAMKKFGVGRSAGVLLKSLVVDGFFVSSLYKSNPKRWLMHGLMLYGFTGLLVADILMQILNPTRADLALTDPLKILPLACGAAVLTGVLYVLFRYKTDEYIDNGVTLGRDFLFVNLLLHVAASGFMTMLINRSASHGYVMPIYLYHLGAVTLLLATAPFTRFMHVWIAPTMVALTRLTAAIAESGVDIGFVREPSPGRHHKSLRIADSVLANVEPEFDGPVRLRYYP